MENNIHTFTHDNIVELLASYYRGKEKQVKAEIFNNHKGYASIKLRENILINGTITERTQILKNSAFEKIIKDIYKLAGQHVTSIVNYGEEGTSVVDRGVRALVSSEQENKIVVTTEEIPKTKVKR